MGIGSHCEEGLPPNKPVDVPKKVLAKLIVAEIKEELRGRAVHFPSNHKKQQLLDQLKACLDLPVAVFVKRRKKDKHNKPTDKARDETETVEVEKELPWDQHHPARKLLIDELMDGGMPLDSESMGPAEVHHKCHKTLEFQCKGMEHGNKFTNHLRSLRETVTLDKKRAKRDKKALAMALKCHPVSSLNHRGQPQWNGSVAQTLLKCDIVLGRHKACETPSELWLSRPQHQAAATSDQFHWKVHQEIGTKKYLYTLKFDAEQKPKQNIEKCHTKKTRKAKESKSTSVDE